MPEMLKKQIKMKIFCQKKCDAKSNFLSKEFLLILIYRIFISKSMKKYFS